MVDNNRENNEESQFAGHTESTVEMSLMEGPRRMSKPRKGLSLVDHELIALALCDERPYISFSCDNGKEKHYSKEAMWIKIKRLKVYVCNLTVLFSGLMLSKKL